MSDQTISRAEAEAVLRQSLDRLLAEMSALASAWDSQAYDILDDRSSGVLSAYERFDLLRSTARELRDLVERHTVQYPSSPDRPITTL